nr:SLC2A4 regulator-like [Penaeus vannamei]
MFKCTWAGCQEMTSACDAIERHIRAIHLGREEVSSEHSDSDSDDEDDHEEEFYWREVEVNVATWVDPCEPLVAPVVPPPTPPAPPAMTVTVAPSPPTPPAAVAQPMGVGIPPGPIQPSHPQYIHVSSPPTLSHMDMARPPHEDPEYRRQAAPMPLSSSWPRTSTFMGSDAGRSA